MITNFGITAGFQQNQCAVIALGMYAGKQRIFDFSKMKVGVVEETAWGWFALFSGLFAVCGAVFKWNIFMNNNHVTSRIWREFLGESGYRFVMVILGAFMFLLGLILTKLISF